MFDDLLEGCQIIDPEWRYVYLNDAVIEQAHKPREELLGRTMMETFPGIENTEMFATLQRVMRERKPERMPNQFVYSDGSVGWFELRIQPWPDGIFILSLDVTPLKIALDHSETQLERLSILHQIDQAITSGADLSAVTYTILDHVTTALGVDAADILLLDVPSLLLKKVSARGFQSHVTEKLTMKVGEGIAGKAALERKTIVLDDLVAEPGFTRPQLARKEGFVSYFGTPLISKGQILGVLECFNRQKKSYNQEWLDYFRTLAGQTAIAVDHTRTFSDLRQTKLELLLAYDNTIEGWASTLELRDIETKGHSQRVTDLTTRLAAQLGHEEGDLVQIQRGALLHDLGKLSIPDAILFKAGKLTKKEWEIMRRHPEVAYSILNKIEFLRPALDIPYCHHEKWDGTGYPRGLRGDAIPEPARLFAVVDVWDALRSDRPYRPRWGEEKALKYIKDQAGSHFDPNAVAAFEKVINS
ncbi:MAG: HD domain-containing phosphohydrolase [Anaerolineales bacterium]